MRKSIFKRVLSFIVILGLFLIVSGLSGGEAAQPPAGGTTAAPAGTRPAGDPTRRRINPGAVEDESETNLTRPESESLYTILLDDFERAGEWFARMPIDQGIVRAKEIWGAPSAVRRTFRSQAARRRSGNTSRQEGQAPDRRGESQAQRMRRGRAYFESEDNEPRKILGVRVEFMQRGFNWFTVEPPRPVNLDGLVKAFEVWICGRNQRHELYIMVNDFNNEVRYIKVGMLNFIGWKRMTAPIPYTIRQSDFRRSIRRGLTFKGFLIRCHPMETIGKFYMYFDNLSVELSRFLEENRDRDDPLDIW